MQHPMLPEIKKIVYLFNECLQYEISSAFIQRDNLQKTIFMLATFICDECQKWDTLS